VPFAAKVAFTGLHLRSKGSTRESRASGLVTQRLTTNGKMPFGHITVKGGKNEETDFTNWLQLFSRTHRNREIQRRNDEVVCEERL
jgi:hypothetical protein